MGETKAELFAVEGQHTGLLVAVWLDLELAEQLAIEGGESPDQLHVTLCYCGDANQMSDVQISAAITAVANAAATWGPMKGQVAGIGRFSASESSDGLDVFYANVDVPGMERVREYLAAALDIVGCFPKRTHGYTPHITLAYIDPDDDLPMQRLPESLPFVINSIWVGVGDRRTEIPLTGEYREYDEFKAGARHSRRDTAMLQTMHDHAVALGASCGSKAANIDPPRPTELIDAPPEFYERVWRLIDAYYPHLAEARIRVQVREQAVVTSGSAAYGQADTANNEAEKEELDFSISFALDKWVLLDEFQRDALTEHELQHCGWNEQGEPHLIGHDLEEFFDVMLRYGPWWPDADEFLNVLAAMPMEGVDKMAKYQRPMPGGGHGSTGAYQRPLPGGGHGSTGAYQRPVPGGGHGSTGAFELPLPGGGHGSTGAYILTDPALDDGMDYEPIDLGNGVILELSPESYAALAAFFAGGPMANMRGNALKTIGKTATELRVGNYIALFGGRDLEGIASKRKNQDGSRGEFFSRRTNFKSAYTDVGVLYVDWEHGAAFKGEPDADDVLGYVDWKTAKQDDKGLFVERVLNRRNQYVRFLEDLIDEGLIGNSSEAVGGAVSKAANGEILHWPLRRDTLTVQPMEPRMLSANAIGALKALSGRNPALKTIVDQAEQFASAKTLTPEAGGSLAADVERDLLLLELDVLALN